MQNKPNFLIAGAPKCGTTSMYHYLKQHPEVYFPDRKEPYYFVQPASLLGTGPGQLGSGSIQDWDIYRHLYDDHRATQCRVLGDASAGYLYFWQHSIPLIKKALGDPAILIMLRNPAERSLSSHLHHIRRGFEPLSFEKALRAEASRRDANWWYGFRLTDVSLYAESVSAYQKSFSKVLVLLDEDLRADPVGTCQRIFSFLGVDASFVPDTATRHNTAEKTPRYCSVEKILTRIETQIGRVLPWRVRPVFRAVVKRVRLLNRHHPVMRASTRRALVQAFHEDVLAVQSLIGRDLDHWLQT